MEPILATMTAPGALDAGLLLDRTVVGFFFTVTGAFKLTVWRCHMRRTMTELGVFAPGFNARFVPAVQFLAGAGTLVGLAAPLAALGLIVVMAVALWYDGRRKVQEMEPESLLEHLDDWCYLPETLYIAMLMPILLGGAGAYSIDTLIRQWAGL